ncbi:hypothetical protein [Pseudomonas sp. IPO3778]|uniref:hypothetical protein n=1 Tax=unclassified Pseudomonas TaxID=196821 RepID=UPI0035BF0511
MATSIHAGAGVFHHLCDHVQHGPAGAEARDCLGVIGLVYLGFLSSKGASLGLSKHL